MTPPLPTCKPWLRFNPYCRKSSSSGTSTSARVLQCSSSTCPADAHKIAGSVSSNRASGLSLSDDRLRERTLRKLFVNNRGKLRNSSDQPVLLMGELILREGEVILRRALGNAETPLNDTSLTMLAERVGLKSKADGPNLLADVARRVGGGRNHPTLRDLLHFLRLSISTDDEAREARGNPERGRTLHSITVDGSTFHIDKRYSPVRTIGHGAYGLVISAKDSFTGEMFAIKKVARAFEDLVDARRVLREIKFFRHLGNHENILHIHDIGLPRSYSKSGKTALAALQSTSADAKPAIQTIHPHNRDFNDIYIISEIMETDLHRVIYSRQKLTDDHVQYFTYQILRGMKYIHSANVCHRDLKPSNILVNSNCDLKICDFGLSRGIYDAEKEHEALLTEYVVTRWYRAPEIMLCAGRYDKAVDMWSIGCILAELLGRKPIFPGNDYIEQLELIFDKLGTYTELELQSFVKAERAQSFVRNRSNTKRRWKSGLRGEFPTTNPAAVSLLEELLNLNPSKRISAEDGLAHPYLSGLYDADDEPNAICSFEFSALPMPDDNVDEEHLEKYTLVGDYFEEIGLYHPEILQDHKEMIESTLLPPPPEVQLWLDGKFSDDDKVLTIQINAALLWLNKALVAAHHSPAVKAKAKQLLCVHEFTSNLLSQKTSTEIDALQARCRVAATRVGNEMRAHYVRERLGSTIGSFSVPEKPAFRNNRRQDNTEVGLPLPPRHKGDADCEWEAVVAHALRLVGKAIDEDFHEICSRVTESHGGEFKRTATKGHARIMAKCTSDHRYEMLPRPMLNIDVVRNACTFESVEALQAAAAAMCIEFGGAAARVKNGFSPEVDGATQHHYRTLMVNWVFVPGYTYGEMAQSASGIWNRHYEGPPDPTVPWELWRSQAQRALVHLRSAQIASMPVRLVCETQLLLRPYLEGRRKMHLLYKVVRAADGEKLHNDFMSGATELWPPGTTYMGEQNEMVPRALAKVESGIKRDEVLRQCAVAGETAAVEALLERGVSVDAVACHGTAPLMLAARAGHVSVVNVLLTWKACVNGEMGSNGATPLLMAVQKGHLDVIRALLAHGANADKAGTDTGMSPLCLAASKGHTDVVKLLLGKDVSAVRSIARDGTSPLWHAALNGYADVVDVLLNKSMNVDSREFSASDGTTPLWQAALNGHADVVNALLEKNADVDHANAKGETPLYAAARNGNWNIVQTLLVNSADVNKTDKLENAPLWKAVTMNRADMVNLLLDHGADLHVVGTNGTPPFHAAAVTPHWNMVKLLLERGADVNGSVATQLLFKAAEVGYVKMVRELLLRGVCVNNTSEYGISALQAAAEGGHAEVVMALLESKADVNNAGVDGMSSLHAAVGFRIGAWHQDVVELLLDGGADVNQGNAEGETPLLVAAGCGHMDAAELLLKKGADLNKESADGFTPFVAAAERGHQEVVKLLLGSIEDINRAVLDETTPVHIAARFGHWDVVKLLIKKGARLDAGENEITLLFRAAEDGRVDVVRKLIEEGADVNKTNADGSTPLHAAARGKCVNIEKRRSKKKKKKKKTVTSKGRKNKGTLPQMNKYIPDVEMVRVLLDRGAEVNKVNVDGTTPLSTAVRLTEATESEGVDDDARAGYREVVRLLEEHSS